MKILCATDPLFKSKSAIKRAGMLADRLGVNLLGDFNILWPKCHHSMAKSCVDLLGLEDVARICCGSAPANCSSETRVHTLRTLPVMPPLSSRSVRIIALPKGRELTQEQQVAVAGDEAARAVDFCPARQQQRLKARHM